MHYLGKICKKHKSEECIFLKAYKILNTKSAVIDKIQLQNYLEKLASDHILMEKSEKNTYPIPRMIDNFEFITDTYKLLNEHIKLKIPIHPAISIMKTSIRMSKAQM